MTYHSPTTSESSDDLRLRLKQYFQTTVHDNKDWLKTTMGEIMNGSTDTVPIDMTRLTTLMSSHLYWLILCDTPPPITMQFSHYLGRFTTNMTKSVNGCDILFVIYLMISQHREITSNGSDSSESLPEFVRNMYS